MRLPKKKLSPLQVQTLGDAHFATPEETAAAGLLGKKGIRLGYYKAPDDRSEGWGEVVRYNGDAHLITVAPTRSGKGRDVLIPALLEYSGSCIVIDPKGQLAAVTKAQRERMGQRVIVLNPFNLLPEELGPTAQYNPMMSLDPQADSFGADCDSLADAIVTNDNREDSHWSDSARQLVSGIIMHLAAHDERVDRRHLATVRRIISGPTSALKVFVQTAMDADRDDGFITQKLARFEDVNEESRELLGIISTANTQTGFIGNKAIAASLSGSDFRFRDLKNVPTTVYLVLPAKYLQSCGKWFRLVIASALADLWSETRGAVPVLAILDEFAQLGRLQAIENSMGLAAGFGLQLWPVLQNLTQLKRDYGDNWETFLGSAAVRQFFAPQDDFTADYISKMCGVKTVVTSSESIQHGAELLEKNRKGASWSQQSQPLLHPHNVRGLGPQECLILGPQNAVIDAFRKPYRQTPEFEGLYSPDPYHKTDATAKSASAGSSNFAAPKDSFASREVAARTANRSGISRLAWPIRIPAGIINFLLLRPIKGFLLNKWALGALLVAMEGLTYSAASYRVMTAARNAREEIGPFTQAERTQKEVFLLWGSGLVTVSHYVWNHTLGTTTQASVGVVKVAANGHPSTAPQEPPRTAIGRALHVVDSLGSDAAAHFDREVKRGSQDDPDVQEQIRKAWEEQEKERKERKAREEGGWLTTWNKIPEEASGPPSFAQSLGPRYTVGRDQLYFFVVSEREATALLERGDDLVALCYETNNFGTNTTRELPQGFTIRPVLKNPSDPNSYVKAAYARSCRTGSTPAILVEDRIGELGIVAKTAVTADGR